MFRLTDRRACRGHAGLRFALCLLLALAALGPFLAPGGARASGPCIVMTLADTGPGSLRACLADTNVSAITFQAGLTGTVTLASALPAIGRDLTITGPGQLLLTISGNDAVRIFEVTGGTVTISGMKLTHGKASNDFGGGIAQSAGNLTVQEVTIDTNSAYAGGGVSLAGGTMTVANSLLIGNSASRGGGIVQFGGTLAVNQSTVSRNAADIVGGGISNGGGTLTVTGSTLAENSVSGSGGGIGQVGLGGPITLVDSTVSGNSAVDGGGINAFGALTISGSTISGNSAYNGGGLVGGSSTLATNSTISGNSARFTAGGILTGGPMTLRFVTVTGNIGDNRNTGIAQGGGIYATSPTTISASIVIGNTLVTSAGSGNDCVIDGGAITFGGGNVIGGGTGCPAAGGDSFAGSTGAVLNTALADNGGPTKTHALVAGSPAIDRVEQGVCQTLLTAPRSDQRAQSRPQGNACDSGAYEAQQRKLTLSINGQGTISPGNTFYPDGAVASLSAIPAAGAVFAGWTLDGSPAGTANPLTVTMGADHSILATFALQLALTTSGNGQVEVSPPGGIFTATTQQYASGSVVTLTPRPAPGQTFTGWLVDGQPAGWATSLTITMNAGHTVQATFVPTPAFGDVPGEAAYATAVAQLAARGIIKGCDQAAQPPLFCPNDPTLRAQLAALIVRAMPGWSAETWPNTFTDPLPDGELWGRVATLQHYQVAQGYQADVCLAQGKTSPCFGPLDTVTYGQVLLFVSRAMVNHGYWTLQPDDRALFPELNGTGDPADRATQDHQMLVTYLHYAGTIPDVDTTPGVAFRVQTAGQPAVGWGDAAPRAWFARAFWPALDGYFGVDQPGFGGNVP